MNISLNNQILTFQQGVTLLELLRESNYDPEKKLFAVALNNTFVSKEQYEKIELKDQDKVDVLQPITGG